MSDENVRDLIGAPAGHAPLSVEQGTIGWHGDTDTSYFDKGTQDNGNVTFVRVTLYRGRNQAEPLTPEVAQGHQIVAQLATPGMGIPARNSKCTVVFPSGFAETVGGGVIVATQGDPRDAMNKAFIRNEDGKVTLMTVDKTADEHAIYLQLDPEEGLVFVSPWGTLTYGPKGFHLRHISGARINLGAVSGMPSPLDALGSYATISAAITHIEGSVVQVGPAAGVSDAVVKNVPFLAFMDTLMTAIGTAVSGAGPGGPAAAGALATAYAAMTVEKAAIPSTTAQVI